MDLNADSIDWYGSPVWLGPLDLVILQSVS